MALQTPGVWDLALSVFVSFPASVQVEEGSSKPSRDFTHSTAGLIQFDPGAAVLFLTLELCQRSPLSNYRSQKALL